MKQSAYGSFGKLHERVEPPYLKRAVQKREKPRLWESWLSMVGSCRRYFCGEARRVMRHAFSLNGPVQAVKNE
jgi:hypothetical protein